MDRLNYPVIVTAALSLSIAACGGVDQSKSANNGTGAGQGKAQLLACGQTAAPGLFEHALCICDDFDKVGSVSIGPGPTGDRASLAVNGRSNVVSRIEIDGDWIAYGGVNAVSSFSVKGDLRTAESVDFVGELDVTGDLSVGTDLSGVGSLKVGGELSMDGDDRVIGYSEIGSRGPFTGPTAQPCGCDENTFLDVAGMVELARTNNDNAALDFEETIVRNIGSGELELTTGRYFLESIDAIGEARLVVTGVAALYVASDVNIIGDGRIEIAEGASLDLYIAGSLRNVGQVILGDPSHPEAFRLYLGGEGSTRLAVGNNEVFGSVYAPAATIAWVGNTRAVGSIYADHIDGVGNLEVLYQSPVAIEVPPEDCPAPPETEIPAGEDNPADGDGEGTGTPDV